MVRALHSRQIPAAAAVLSRAFSADALFAHVFQSPAVMARHAPWMFGSWLAWGIRAGTCWVTEEGSGVMLCHGPGANGYRVVDMLRSGMVLTPFKLPWPVFARLGRIGAQIERRRHEIMRDERGGQRHWYCQMLGVDPARQGQGIGSALLRHLLEQADHAGGCPCYLETSKQSNADFYSRYGFELRGTQPMDGGAWTLYFMCRPARA